MNDLPPLPAGFTGRNASLDDVHMAAQAGIAYALATTGFSDRDAETLRNMWEEPGFDPAQDIYLVHSPQGGLAAILEVWANQVPPVHPFIWGIVMPEFQGQGIGSHILAWGEQRARAALERVDPGVRVAPVGFAPSVVTASKALLENNGWSHIRSFYTMGIELDGAPAGPELPEGIELQSYRPEDAPAVYRAVDESFADHFGHVERPFEIGLERFMHDRIEDPLFDPGLWFIAWQGDQIAGISLCRSKSWDDPESGHVWTLGVRRPWRKRGLGLALLRESFREFHRRGYRKVNLGVDAGNITGALRLYEKAGMHVIREFAMYEKEIRPGRELRVQEIEE
jgi:ribosomal protein S18 acetylase RimI-like enzyme